MMQGFMREKEGRVKKEKEQDEVQAKTTELQFASDSEQLLQDLHNSETGYSSSVFFKLVKTPNCTWAVTPHLFDLLLILPLRMLLVEPRSGR